MLYMHQSKYSFMFRITHLLSQLGQKIVAVFCSNSLKRAYEKIRKVRRFMGEEMELRKPDRVLAT